MLDFFADEARRFPDFRLLMLTEAQGLIETGEGITGLDFERPVWAGRAQVLAHRVVLVPAITAKEPPKVPAPLRLFQWLPWLRRLPARAIGLGLRPEHWRLTE